jgi:hypothetical protein
MNNMYARYTQELNVKVEKTQLGLQAVTTSLDTLKKDLHEELNVKFEETYLGLQAVTMILDKRTKSLRKELKAKIKKNAARITIVHHTWKKNPLEEWMWDPRDVI